MAQLRYHVLLLLLLLIIQYSQYSWAVDESERDNNPITRPPSTTEDPNDDDEVSESTYSTACKDVANRTSKQTIKTLLYYRCIPYILGMAQGDENVETLDVYLNTLTDPPNTENPHYKVLISFKAVNLLAFVVAGTSDFQPEVQVQFDLAWYDPRFTWEESRFKFSTYPIDLKPNINIWTPNAVVRGSGSLLSLADSITYYDVKASSSGAVTAVAVGQFTFGKCTADLSQYPFDVLKCCADLTMTPSEKIYASVSNVSTSWDSAMLGIWQIDSLTLKTQRSKPLNQIEMCIISKRNTGAVGLEMSLPMIVSAVVLMCAQLAGKWKMQVYVKLFAILIQIFAFENLAPNDALANATETPKVYIFYNFTVCLTIVSLFQTMLFWALSRRWFLMPPPYALTLHTKVISRFLLGDKLERVHDAENRPIENGGGIPNPTNQNAQDLNNNSNEGGSPGKKYSNRKEWEAIFATVHAITSILIIVIYVVGVIVIYAAY